MKDGNLLIWLTQLGLSVAVPLAVFLGGAVWLHRSRGWGTWIVWAGLLLGLSSAVSGFGNEPLLPARCSCQNRLWQISSSAALNMPIPPFPVGYAATGSPYVRQKRSAHGTERFSYGIE